MFSADVKFSGFSVQEMAIKFGQLCVLAVGAFVVFIYFMPNSRKQAQNYARTRFWYSDIVLA